MTDFCAINAFAYCKQALEDLSTRPRKRLQKTPIGEIDDLLLCLLESCFELHTDYVAVDNESDREGIVFTHFGQLLEHRLLYMVSPSFRKVIASQVCSGGGLHGAW